MSILLEDSPSDEPRPSLPGIHSLFSKEDAQPAAVGFPGTLSVVASGTSGRPGSRGLGSGPPDVFETFSLSSESGSSRMGSLSSIASKGSPTTHQVGPPSVAPPGWHANRASYSAGGIDPLAEVNSGQSSHVSGRRASEVKGGGGVYQGGGVSATGGGSGGVTPGWSPSAAAAARNPSTANASAHNDHQQQDTQQINANRPRGSDQTIPQPPSQYGPYGSSSSSSFGARPNGLSDAPFDAPSAASHRHSASFSGPSVRMQPSSSSSTAVMRPPSPLRPYSAGNGYGPVGGFARAEGGGAPARGQELVFYDDADPNIDPSRQQTFQGGPVRRGSEVSSHNGSRRGSMVDPRSAGAPAGPDRSSTFLNHPSAHPYHPYGQQSTTHHPIHQQHYQPTPISAGGQPLFHPHSSFVPVQAQPGGGVQSLPFPQQTPFQPNPSTYPPNYNNQQAPFYLPPQSHPHQQQQQTSHYGPPANGQQPSHARLQQPLLHSVPTAPAPHLHHQQHASSANEWQRRNSLPTNAHHSHQQRMQMMPPPPVPPVWQREGAHQQHVFAGTPVGQGGASSAEAMRRASDGDLLTGPSGGKESKYDCPFCGKKFNRPSSLKIHTYSHTGEKPFTCNHPQCGRKFSVQSNLKRHTRTHSTTSSDPSRPSSSHSGGVNGAGGAGTGFDPDVDAEGEEDEL